MQAKQKKKKSEALVVAIFQIVGYHLGNSQEKSTRHFHLSHKPWLHKQ